MHNQWIHVFSTVFSFVPTKERSRVSANGYAHKAPLLPIMSPLSQMLVSKKGHWRILVISIFLVLSQATAYAQLSNLKSRWVSTKQETILDTLTVSPGSLKMLTPADTAVQLIFNPDRNAVSVNNAPSLDSVLISYRVFPFNLSKLYYRRDIREYDSAAFFSDIRGGGLQLKPLPEAREEFFATKGINKNGSITRGISVGNTQNVFVNSALNLQLDGQLTDEISLTAVISDQNVPFQPEGNTQQLQDFDKVFVQLGYKNKVHPANKASLTVGDIVMRNQPTNDRGAMSNFLRYYKNVQGGQVATTYSLDKRDSSEINAQTSVGIAVAKGKFASTLIEAIEGSQGPYRLRGPNNERFIIVLANSEKVYLDGRLLQRGYNFDYIIDYNQAEIIFNTNIVITKFSRIRVDFEYSDRNYSRTILNAQHNQRLNKLSLSTGFYAEKDNPRNPLLLSLSNEDKVILSEIGDSLQNALAPSATLLPEFNANQVLYRRIDTLVDGASYASVYVYSTDPATALYQVLFSEVGTTRGSYRLKTEYTINGRVYEWVGIGRGNYEPVRLLPAPNKKQMVTLGGDYALTANETIFGEMAFSQQDVNLFSPLNASDDKGTALKVGYANKGRNLKALPGYQWIGSLDYEKDDKNFRAIDRFRDIEFDRDWSANIDSARADDHIFNVSLGLQGQPSDTAKGKTPRSNVDRFLYRFSRRERGSEINGYQHRIDLNKQVGNWLLTTNFFLLKNRKAFVTSDWQRLRTELSYQGRWLVPGYAYSLDHNKFTSASTNSVVGTAMNFDEHKVFVRSNDSLKTRFSLDYAYRQDNDTLEGKLVKNNVAHTSNLSFASRIKESQEINLLFTYRKIENLRKVEPTTVPSEETIMGRIDWNGDFLKRVIRSEFTLAVATGRELRREYIFLPVPTGQGTHTWRDENGDGVKDLNEFYEAINFDERIYVKFFVPTDQYVQAYTNNFNYRLNITPPRAWREGGPMLAFLSKLSNASSWSINRRMTDVGILERFLPFASLGQSNILSTQDALRSTLFFNRSNPGYGMELAALFSRQKQLLTNGFEGRNAEEYRFNTRVNIKKVWNVKLGTGRLLRTTQSDFLSARNYQIETYQTKPELTFQPSSNLRFTGAYGYSRKRNVFSEASMERANLNEVSLEMRWTKVSERTLSTTMRYVQIDFQGDPNTALGYELLESLQPGNNLTWSMYLQQRLGNGLQLSINYDGRKAATQNIVHIGRIQIAALF